MKDGRRFGKPPVPYVAPATPTGKVNTTDPDSRNVKTPRGYLQGYNAQAVCNEHQIVVAAELNNDSSDSGHLEPMVRAAERELTAAGIATAPALVVADAGYWNHDQLDALAAGGITALVPPDAGKRRGTRPGWDGGRYAFMRRVLESEAGGALYGKRKSLIEPVFANTKFNRGFDRFLRRGRAACRSEWRLIAATHNLLKLHRHEIGLAAA
jgi:DDE family transposase